MNIIKKDRIAVLAAVLAVLLVVYIIALYKLQIIEGEAYYEESRNFSTTTSTVIGARGNILDRYGRVLVTNKSCYNLVINTNELFPSDGSVDSNKVILELINMVREYGDDFVDDLPITAQPPFEYTEMTPVDKARLDKYKENRKLDANASAVEVLSDMRTRYEVDSNYTAEEARAIIAVRYAVNVRYLINTSDYIFVEDADMELISKILENNITGVSVKESYVREYNTEYAAHILGYVNWISDSQYEKYVTNMGYAADTKVGQEGAELAFEKYLHGTNGLVKTTSAPDGTVISVEYVKEPEPGNNVYLTIDGQLQEITERALQNGVTQIQTKLDTKKEQEIAAGTYKEKLDQITGAAVVVVDVNTGEPLAIASWPSYDASTLLDNYAELLADKSNPLYNRALQGTYAPGSTFKPCTSIAALSEKIINTATTVECRGKYTRYEAQGYAPWCWWEYGHGYDNIVEALRDSCNVFFYETGHNLGIDKMRKYAALLGLGETTGIELPESKGNMSNPENHFDLVGEDWTIGDTMQAAIGQSDSVFTPLQLAEYCAAIANGGERHSASILKSVRSFDYSDNIYERENEVLSKIDSEQYNWDAIHEGMYLVANDPNGSGYAAFRDYTASTVACKTGTAQKGESVSNDGIFICYAPYENPQIAIAIVVERGGAGANCAPIAREILEAYFSIRTATDVTETEGSLLK